MNVRYRPGLEIGGGPRVGYERREGGNRIAAGPRNHGTRLSGQKGYLPFATTAGLVDWRSVERTVLYGYPGGPFT